MEWKCAICLSSFLAGEILNHIRLMHPDLEVKADHWPDGEPVIYEDADEFFL